MKKIKILSGRCLLVRLPEEAKNTRIQSYPNHPMKLWYEFHYEKDDMPAFNSITLPPGNWRIIGMLSEVTENQAKELVDKTDTHPKYWNYNLNYHREFYALESLESAIRAEGYYLDENPLPDPESTMMQGDGYVYYGADDKDFEEYEKAQSRVLDRARCLLLRRVDG